MRDESCRIDKGAGPPLARLTTPATVTGAVGVGYLDEGVPAPLPAPSPVPALTRKAVRESGPVGVGYLDEATPAPVPAAAPPMGVGYLDA